MIIAESRRVPSPYRLQELRRLGGDASARGVGSPVDARERPQKKVGATEGLLLGRIEQGVEFDSDVVRAQPASRALGVPVLVGKRVAADPARADDAAGLRT